MNQRGFLLQAGCRFADGRAIWRLLGRLESGPAFVLEDDRILPAFGVRERDAPLAEKRGWQRDPRPWESLEGEPLARLLAPGLTARKRFLEELSAAGLPSFEGDLSFALQPLIDRGIRGSLRIDGEPRMERGQAYFDRPEIEAADWTPSLRLLSLDIETDPRASRVLSVALHGCGVAEVLIHAPEEDCPPPGRPFPDERALLRGLDQRIRELDPDVITGWNVVSFDLRVLARRARRLGVRFRPGRLDEPWEIRPLRFGRARFVAELPGRCVLDGLELVRGAHLHLPRYSLEAVAQRLLGTGKTLKGEGRGEKILELFERDRTALIEYNLVDAELVTKILEKLGLLELAVARCRLTGLPLERVGASVAAFDSLYLSRLHQRRIGAPTTGDGPPREVHSSGGHVFEPHTGLHDSVWVFDFKSLYPSVIRTFRIDPLGFARAGADPDPIVTPGGARFARDGGILPGLLDELTEARQAAVTDGRRVAEQAIKILMNSFYGVLGTSACRFGRSELASAVTESGRELLRWSRNWFLSRGFVVVYGDTDSLFVPCGTTDPEQAVEEGTRIAAKLNDELSGYLAHRYRVTSRLELQFEKLYCKLLLPMARGRRGGARKRYVGLRYAPDGSRLELVGMEAVRRDWTELAGEVQRELYRRLFLDLPLDEYVAEVVRRLRRGELDEKLVYRKALRRKLDSYRSATPPHVAAARKLDGPEPRVVRYWITSAGPEPVERRRAPIDYEHYVNRQIRAVVQPVLELQNRDFEEIVETGDPRQGRLF